jgi:hypothetical protein
MERLRSVRIGTPIIEEPEEDEVTEDSPSPPPQLSITDKVYEKLTYGSLSRSTKRRSKRNKSTLPRKSKEVFINHRGEIIHTSSCQNGTCTGFGLDDEMRAAIARRSLQLQAHEHCHEQHDRRQENTHQTKEEVAEIRKDSLESTEPCSSEDSLEDQNVKAAKEILEELIRSLEEHVPQGESEAEESDARPHFGSRSIDSREAHDDWVVESHEDSQSDTGFEKERHSPTTCMNQSQEKTGCVKRRVFVNKNPRTLEPAEADDLPSMIDLDKAPVLVNTSSLVPQSLKNPRTHHRGDGSSSEDEIRLCNQASFAQRSKEPDNVDQKRSPNKDKKEGIRKKFSLLDHYRKKKSLESAQTQSSGPRFRLFRAKSRDDLLDGSSKASSSQQALSRIHEDLDSSSGVDSGKDVLSSSPSSSSSSTNDYHEHESHAAVCPPEKVSKKLAFFF